MEGIGRGRVAFFLFSLERMLIQPDDIIGGPRVTSCWWWIIICGWLGWLVFVFFFILLKAKTYRATEDWVIILIFIIIIRSLLESKGTHPLSLLQDSEMKVSSLESTWTYSMYDWCRILRTLMHGPAYRKMMGWACKMLHPWARI